MRGETVVRQGGRVVLAALIIVFREVFEAGLIIGIVLAVTRSVPHRNQWVGGGVLAGVLAACTVAALWFAGESGARAGARLSPRFSVLRAGGLWPALPFPILLCSNRAYSRSDCNLRFQQFSASMG